MRQPALAAGNGDQPVHQLRHRPGGRPGTPGEGYIHTESVANGTDIQGVAINRVGTSLCGWWAGVVSYSWLGIEGARGIPPSSSVTPCLLGRDLWT